MAKEIDDLIQRVNKAIRSDAAMRAALTTTMAVHKPRIFEKGLDANGGKIGTYSKEPISIAKNRQARNTGKTYFKGGYDEYKKSIGKNPGFVNLRDTDQMQMDYGVQGGNGQWGFGFNNEVNYNKSQWLQEKYDRDIFDLSDQELNVFGDVLKNEVEKLL